MSSSRTALETRRLLAETERRQELHRAKGDWRRVEEDEKDISVYVGVLDMIAANEHS